MIALFQAHSGLRYLVFLAGIAAIVVFAVGLAAKAPFTKQARIMGSVFSGLLDTQVVLGVVLAAMGLFTPKLMGHIVMMLAAAVLAHVMLGRNRRQPTPGYTLPLIGVGGALALIIVGIFAIGRLPWAMSAMGG